MGHFQTVEMIESAGLYQSLRWHLQYNHYPPIPEVFVSLCERAIDHANADDWDAVIELPDGVLWRNQSTCPAHALIEWAHLHPFIAGDEDGEYDAE